MGVSGKPLQPERPLGALARFLTAFLFIRSESMTYQDQIKSPKWQKKRLEVLNLNRFKCEECQSESQQLHVHHTYYRKGRKIWEYDNVELKCLCEDCHSKTHDLNDKILQSLGFLEVIADLSLKEQILGYIQGLNGVCSELNVSEKFMLGYFDGCRNIDISDRYEALRTLYQSASS